MRSSQLASLRIRETVHVSSLSRPEKACSEFNSRTIPHSFSEESHFHFQVCFLSASFYCLYMARPYANVIIFQQIRETDSGRMLA